MTALFDELDELDPDHYDDADRIVAKYCDDLPQMAEAAAGRRGIPDADREAWCAAYVSAGTERYREALRAWEGAAR